MTLHVSSLVTHLRPEEAYSLIEFLDQLRNALMLTYGDEMYPSKNLRISSDHALVSAATAPVGDKAGDCLWQ